MQILLIELVDFQLNLTYKQYNDHCEVSRNKFLCIYDINVHIGLLTCLLTSIPHKKMRCEIRSAAHRLAWIIKRWDLNNLLKRQV